MSAEFCITYLAWDKDRKLNFKAGHDYIDGLEADENGIILDEDEGEHTRDSLHEDLKEIEKASDDKHKEGSFITLGHLYILITGGMTWGDDPSELYRNINNLSRIDFSILTKVGFDLPEDTLNYKELTKKIIGVKQVRPLLIGLDENLDRLLEQEERHGKVRASGR